MKLSKLFGVSAIIAGAVAITGNSSSITSTGISTSTTTAWVTATDAGNSSPEIPSQFFYPEVIISPNQSHANVSESELMIHFKEQPEVRLGFAGNCGNVTFGPARRLVYGQCYISTLGELKTIRAQMYIEDIKHHVEFEDACVLVAFEDNNCYEEGVVISNLYQTLFHSAAACIASKSFTEGGFNSFKYVCGPDIDFNDWDMLSEDEDNQFISARSIDAEGGHDRVTVTPADGFNCINAQSRDTDTKHQDRCHSFDKPFFSLSATVKRASHDSIFEGSEPCAVLVFSDEKCSKDGASIVNLNHTPSLGVCHNVSLHHGKDVAAIAGHSWKWICGRQNIDDCLKPVHHSSKQVYPRPTSTVIGGATKTVTATTSLACSITTDSAHYFDVVTSVVTLKPTTHISTSVFTKTKTWLHTKLITSVATDVSTVLHTVTKPYKTTYMVCDVHETPQA